MRSDEKSEQGKSTHVEVESSPAERLAGRLLAALETVLLERRRTCERLSSLAATDRREDVEQPALKGRAVESAKGRDGVGRLDERDVGEAFRRAGALVDGDVHLQMAASEQERGGSERAEGGGRGRGTSAPARRDHGLQRAARDLVS